MTKSTTKKSNLLISFIFGVTCQFREDIMIGLMKMNFQEPINNSHKSPPLIYRDVYIQTDLNKNCKSIRKIKNHKK
jgi:hypothetical protein